MTMTRGSLSVAPSAVARVSRARRASCPRVCARGVDTLVDSRVALPYWDFTVEEARSRTTGESGAVAVHSVAAVVTFLVANVGLTGLQLLWTKKVVRGVQKALGLRAPARKEAASEEERRPLKAAG